jgi:hypothetical protein
VNLQRGCNACRPFESRRVEAEKEGNGADADRSTSHRTLLVVKLLQIDLEAQGIHSLGGRHPVP